MNKFADGTFVNYKLPQFAGVGVVKGISKVKGCHYDCTYIIEDRSQNIPTEAYPYKCMAIPEHLLERQ